MGPSLTLQTGTLLHHSSTPVQVCELAHALASYPNPRRASCTTVLANSQRVPGGKETLQVVHQQLLAEPKCRLPRQLRCPVIPAQVWARSM